jgi:hypothetical protein
MPFQHGLDSLELLLKSVIIQDSYIWVEQSNRAKGFDGFDCGMFLEPTLRRRSFNTGQVKRDESSQAASCLEKDRGVSICHENQDGIKHGSFRKDGEIVMLVDHRWADFLHSDV